MEPKRDPQYAPGGILMPDIGDGRSRLARRFRRLCKELVTEIGGNPTAVERGLIGHLRAV